jgi:DNA polymerase-4
VRSRRGCAPQVRDRVGLPITVGIARTKFLAKVASQEAKPDGLLLVPPGP